MRGAVVAALALAGALAGQAAAASWPDRPVHFIVPYPPGGNADVIGRIVANGLQQKLGQSFIVDNRSGGAGVIGGIAAAHAAPDGYTFLYSANGPILFAPELVTPPPYLWNRDFETVAVVTVTPLVLLVGKNSAMKSLDDLFARSRGGGVIFASGGMASSNHLLGVYMQEQLQFAWTTVHYRGTAPAMNDLIGGQADLAIDQVSSATPFIAAGTVRPLAVTSDHRWPALPEVPTMAELGHPDMMASTFTALMAPAGTPKEIVAKMNAAVSEVAGDDGVRRRIEGIGAEVLIMSAERSAEFMARESSVWIPVVREIAAHQ